VFYFLSFLSSSIDNKSLTRNLHQTTTKYGYQPTLLIERNQMSCWSKSKRELGQAFDVCDTKPSSTPVVTRGHHV